jgi:2-amino-4-hydroxy-6-hydroxymethyldihydropteridine diphosphokinase
MPYEYLIGFGASEGPRLETIQEAIKKLEALGTIKAVSGIHSSAPFGGVAKNEFLNGVLILASDLLPETLMTKLLILEKSLGRDRHEKWADRTIDLDLILEKSGLTMETSLLTLPHPEFHKRSFVLEPALEIASDWIHPKLGRKVEELWGELGSRGPK